VMLPAMVKAGYPKRFSVGVITSSGSLGILIPPSIVMIIYAVATSESAGKMFIAGIVPGILLAAIMMSLGVHPGEAEKFPYPTQTYQQGILALVPRCMGRYFPGGDRDRRDLRRHLHAHRSCCRGCRVCLHRGEILLR